VLPAGATKLCNHRRVLYKKTLLKNRTTSTDEAVAIGVRIGVCHAFGSLRGVEMTDGWLVVVLPTSST